MCHMDWTNFLKNIRKSTATSPKDCNKWKVIERAGVEIRKGCHDFYKPIGPKTLDIYKYYIYIYISLSLYRFLFVEYYEISICMVWFI